MGRKPYMLSLAGRPSLHGYYACMVYWNKGGLWRNCRQKYGETSFSPSQVFPTQRSRGPRAPETTSRKNKTPEVTYRHPNPLGYRGVIGRACLRGYIACYYPNYVHFCVIYVHFYGIIKTPLSDHVPFMGSCLFVPSIYVSPETTRN